VAGEERRRVTPTTDSALGIPQPAAAGAQGHDPGADERRLIAGIITIRINILNIVHLEDLL
jgi:hypothetical protein